MGFPLDVVFKMIGKSAHAHSRYWVRWKIPPYTFTTKKKKAKFALYFGNYLLGPCVQVTTNAHCLTISFFFVAILELLSTVQWQCAFAVAPKIHLILKYFTWIKRPALIMHCVWYVWDQSYLMCFWLNYISILVIFWCCNHSACKIKHFGDIFRQINLLNFEIGDS